MEKEVEFISRDYYFKNEPDNEFFNYSIHGLNFEGIKKYYTIPTNIKYHHMIKVKKDLKNLIENSKKISEERKKKYDRDNVYTDERLYKMYAANKEKKNNEPFKPNFNTLFKFDDNSKNEKIFDKVETTNKPVEIKIEENNIHDKNIKSDSKKKLKNSFNNTLRYSTINTDGSKKSNILSKFNINNRMNRFPLSLNKNKNLNTFHSLRNIKSNKIYNFPIIKPRKIIIETQLINNCGVGNEEKRVGHNSYMGGSYNPFNYYSTPRNRTKRNVYGSLFLH